MKRQVFTSEADLARVVVAWLLNLQWDVYQEVQPRAYGTTADIVATNGPRLCVVECKISMGLRVLNQADDWLRDAHLVYVAVNDFSRNRDERFAFSIARMLGIGVLGIQMNDYSKTGDVFERVPPKLRRRVGDVLRKSLTEEHKTFAAAGNPDGKRWTPFQQTCDQVRRYVQAHPGATLKETIDSVRTHYSTPATARSSLAKWIDAGSVPGLRIERIGRSLRVWPVETAKETK